MTMVDLRVHEVMWCAHHGHPMLTLHLSGTDRFFAVSMAPDDAASLATRPTHGAATSRTRLYSLVESSIAGLGARLTEVQLFVGHDAVLRAVVRITGPAGDLTLPTHFADGIALAHRRRVPLRMSEDDIGRVPSSPAPAVPPRLAADHPGEVKLAPFRDVIDGLDLDDFGPLDGPDRPHGPR